MKLRFSIWFLYSLLSWLKWRKLKTNGTSYKIRCTALRKNITQTHGMKTSWLRRHTLRHVTILARCWTMSPSRDSPSMINKQTWRLTKNRVPCARYTAPSTSTATECESQVVDSDRARARSPQRTWPAGCPMTIYGPSLTLRSERMSLNTAFQKGPNYRSR